MLSINQIVVFFDQEYLLKDFDILNAEGHQ